MRTKGLSSYSVLAGPALGGLLYKPFGVRGPTIFGICVTVLDLVGRLLVIERSEALRWGYDPTVKQSADAERPSGPSLSEGLTMVNPEGSENARPQNSQDEATLRPNNVATVSISVGGSASSALYPPAPFHAGSAQTSLPRVTLVGAMSRLIRSRRALVAFADTLLVGWVTPACNFRVDGFHVKYV